MKNYSFYDLPHAQNYLVGSVVRDSSGMPVYIVDVSNRGRGISATVLYFDQREHVNIPVTKLNLKPVPLGMCNWNDLAAGGKKFVDAAMLYRLPSRQWKVGITTRTMKIVPVRSGEGDSIWLRLEKIQVLQSMALRSTILGEFPSLEEALDRIKGTTYRSVAFSRRFAVKSKGILNYKNEPQPVGQIIRGSPELFKSYEFLKEQLQEDTR